MDPTKKRARLNSSWPSREEMTDLFVEALFAGSKDGKLLDADSEQVVCSHLTPVNTAITEQHTTTEKRKRTPEIDTTQNTTSQSREETTVVDSERIYHTINEELQIDELIDEYENEIIEVKYEENSSIIEDSDMEHMAERNTNNDLDSNNSESSSLCKRKSPVQKELSNHRPKRIGGMRPTPSEKPENVIQQSQTTKKEVSKNTPANGETGSLALNAIEILDDSPTVPESEPALLNTTNSIEPTPLDTAVSPSIDVYEPLSPNTIGALFSLNDFDQIKSDNTTEAVDEAMTQSQSEPVNSKNDADSVHSKDDTDPPLKKNSDKLIPNADNDNTAPDVDANLEESMDITEHSSSANDVHSKDDEDAVDSTDRVNNYNLENDRSSPIVNNTEGTFDANKNDKSLPDTNDVNSEDSKDKSDPLPGHDVDSVSDNESTGFLPVVNDAELVAAVDDVETVPINTVEDLDKSPSVEPEISDPVEYLNEQHNPDDIDHVLSDAIDDLNDSVNIDNNRFLDKSPKPSNTVQYNNSEDRYVNQSTHEYEINIDAPSNTDKPKAVSTDGSEASEQMGDVSLELSSCESEKITENEITTQKNTAPVPVEIGDELNQINVLNMSFDSLPSIPEPMPMEGVEETANQNNESDEDIFFDVEYEDLNEMEIFPDIPSTQNEGNTILPQDSSTQNNEDVNMDIKKEQSTEHKETSVAFVDEIQTEQAVEPEFVQPMIDLSDVCNTQPSQPHIDIAVNLESESSTDTEDDDDDSLPEPLPIPHVDTQFTQVSWRDEETKLDSYSQFINSWDQNNNPTRLDHVLEEDGSLNMWWYDAYDEGRKNVFLYGKVLDTAKNKYVSCCVIVENIQRELYILPRPYKLNEYGDFTEEVVDFEDVKAELTEKLLKRGVTEWHMEVCTRKYAFELPNVPEETQYIKLNYLFNGYSFRENANGQTFSHMFGTSADVLESFIIRNKIMGPCWLNFRNILQTNKKESWCTVEAAIVDPNHCRVTLAQPKPPPLTIMSLALKTRMNYADKQNEILAIGTFVSQNVDIDNQESATSFPYQRFSILKKLAKIEYSEDDVINENSNINISFQAKEEGLLYSFLAKLQLLDPDIIVGHNFTNFDLDILLHRMKKFNILNWSRLGRRRKTDWPKIQFGAGGSSKSGYGEQLVMCGRLVCDTYIASQDLVRSKSYRLSDLALSQLNITRNDFGPKEIELYSKRGNLNCEMARHCTFDAYLAFALMTKLQILPLSKKLTNLSGNLWSRSINGARAERNEFLLLHTFSKLNYICPDKVDRWNGTAEDKLADNLLVSEPSNDLEKSETTSYAGGLVLEPKSGFYDKYVLLLDFNSLYPSIMQEYNVCFTTVDRKSKEEESFASREAPSVPSDDCPKGVLPELVRMFVQRRQDVKKLMKDPSISPSVRMQYDIEQMALKLTANSMYGCLGSPISRFYARPLAMLITSKGREILQSTVDLVESLGHDVIYGDTDSIMINTNQSKLSKVKKLGEKVKKKVNRRYKYLKLDVDGYFRHTLLQKKKKYAALLVKATSDGSLEEFIEVKGLDLVRRDWCDLSHSISEYVLKLILSDQSREAVVEDIHNYMKDVARLLKQYDLKDFIIRMQLTKSLEEYGKKSNTHVRVAKDMRRAGIDVKSGDTVPYVICSHVDENGETIIEPCMPELVSSKKKELDYKWYLVKQILPPVDRLCNLLEGVDFNSLADCLGLSKNDLIKRPRKSKASAVDKEVEIDQVEEADDYSLHFNDNNAIELEPLYFRCNLCRYVNYYTGPIKNRSNGAMSGLCCESCGESFNTAGLQTTVKSRIIKYITTYYNSNYICNRLGCEFSTHLVPLKNVKCSACLGDLVREHTAKSLFVKLSQLSQLFDIEQVQSESYDVQSQNTVQIMIEMMKQSSKLQTLQEIKELVDEYITFSKYNYVNIINALQDCWTEEQ